MTRPTCVASHVDAIDNAHAGLQLQVQAEGHTHIYGEALANLRSLVASLRKTLDDRATGEFPKLHRERRETPGDPTPRDEDLPPIADVRRPIVEHRRRPYRRDDDR